MTTNSGLRELVAELVELWRIGTDVKSRNDGEFKEYNKGAQDQRLLCVRALEKTLTAAGDAQPTAPAGLWTISFEDERDFLSSASPIIGAVYSVGIEAVSRINKNPRGVKMLYGKVSSRAPTTPVQAGIEEKDSDEYEDDRPAKSPSAQDVAFAEGFRQGVKHGESLVPAGMVLVPRKVTEAMNDAYNDVPSGFAGSPPASQWVWDAMLAAAPAAQVAEHIDPDSRNFKEGMAVGQSCEQALADKIRNPACDRCGARGEEESREKCSSYADDCPGAEFPLAQLWELSKAAAPAVVVDEAMVERYLAAQLAAVEEADQFGRPNAGGLHHDVVREACRKGLTAALKHGEG